MRIYDDWPDLVKTLRRQDGGPLQTSEDIMPEMVLFASPNTWEYEKAEANPIHKPSSIDQKEDKYEKWVKGNPDDDLSKEYADKKTKYDDINHTKTINRGEKGVFLQKYQDDMDKLGRDLQTLKGQIDVKLEAEGLEDKHIEEIKRKREEYINSERMELEVRSASIRSNIGELLKFGDVINNKGKIHHIESSVNDSKVTNKINITTTQKENISLMRDGDWKLEFDEKGAGEHFDSEEGPRLLRLVTLETTDDIEAKHAQYTRDVENALQGEAEWREKNKEISDEIDKRWQDLQFYLKYNTTFAGSAWRTAEATRKDRWVKGIKPDGLERENLHKIMDASVKEETHGHMAYNVKSSFFEKMKTAMLNPNENAYTVMTRAVFDEMEEAEGKWALWISQGAAGAAAERVATPSEEDAAQKVMSRRKTNQKPDNMPIMTDTDMKKIARELEYELKVPGDIVALRDLHGIRPTKENINEWLLSRKTKEGHEEMTTQLKQTVDLRESQKKYKVIKRAVIRKTKELDSDQIGELIVDEEINVLEEQDVDKDGKQIHRVRFDRGWTSITSSTTDDLLLEEI